jgi:hypothetical protein
MRRRPLPNAHNKSFPSRYRPSAIPIVVVFEHGPWAIAAVAAAYVLVLLRFLYLATHIATSKRTST